MARLRIAAAQLNVTVGDLDGNVALLEAAYDEAEAAGADLVVFPELAVTGYPPEDLLLRPSFVAGAGAALARFASGTRSVAAFVGYPEAGRDLHNSVAVCAAGRVVGHYRKQLLPNYGVFDEARYFTPGSDPGPLFVVAGVRVAVSVCEDIWSPTGPLATQAAGGAELAVNLNASPYHLARLAEREAMLSTRAADSSLPLVYVNLVGGQDELIFDGASLVFDPSGRLLARGRQFEPDLLIVDVDVPPSFRRRLRAARGRVGGGPLPEVVISESPSDLAPGKPARIERPLGPEAEVWAALVTATGDYVRKNGFTDVVIGLSGGIDSSLVAAIAVDALGAECVVGVRMPSRFSSEGSLTDAAALADGLAFRCLTLPIEAAHAAFLATLAGPFAEGEPGVAEENLQARIRGTLLMALSNRFGWLVLTTGNKSETATGYSTLYGDMAGGFAVLKDVDKTLVYRLAHWRNEEAGTEVIPAPVLTKAPSAELRPGQKDADSLPPYGTLDAILDGYVEGDASVADLVAAGYDPDTVARVARLVDGSEYKRRQGPPGVRITTKAFGRDRRLPITNRFQDTPPSRPISARKL